MTVDIPQRDRETIEAYRASSLALHEDRWLKIVPEEFVAARVDDLGVSVGAAVEAWVSGPSGPALLLYGPNGTGKTHAAASAARVRYDAGDSVAFWRSVLLYEELRPDGGLRLADLTDVDVLILDDLGAEKVSEWTRERLDAIVDVRWSEHRRTVVTTNLEPTELSRTLTGRVWSRITDEAVAVRVSGEDRRG